MVEASRPWRSVLGLCAVAGLVVLIWAAEAHSQWARRLRFSRGAERDTTRILPSGDVLMPTVRTTVAEKGGTMKLDFKDTIRTFRDGVDVASGRVLLRGPDAPVPHLVVYFAYIGPGDKRVPVAFDTTDTEGRYHLVAPNPTNLRYEIMTRPVEPIVLGTVSTSEPGAIFQPQPLRPQRP